MSCTGFSVFLVCVRIHTHAIDTSSPAVQGSSLCQFVFAQQKHVCLSSPCVALRFETHTATATHFSISETGGDLSIITMPSSASQRKTSFQHEFTSRNLSCTISSIDGVNASRLAKRTRCFRTDHGDSESRSDGAAGHTDQSPLLTLASLRSNFDAPT